MQHLRKVFETFQKNNISIKSFKSFLGYLSIHLLDQKIDSLKLATEKKKLRVINKLTFSKILRQLKHYLDLTSWMKKYVKKYIKMIKSLQIRKISLLRKFSQFDNVRRFYFFKSIFANSILKKRETFNTLQKKNSKTQYFVHYDSKRQLYINVDFSKKSNMKVMIYYTKNFTIKSKIYYVP